MAWLNREPKTTPSKTFFAGYFVAKDMASIWVLSPISAIKIKKHA